MKRSVTFAEELEDQDDPLLDAMEYYDAEMTREEYVATNYLGEIGTDEVIPAVVESTLPKRFQRATLVETQSASGYVQ